MSLTIKHHTYSCTVNKHLWFGYRLTYTASLSLQQLCSKREGNKDKPRSNNYFCPKHLFLSQNLSNIMKMCDVDSGAISGWFSLYNFKGNALKTIAR